MGTASIVDMEQMSSLQLRPIQACRVTLIRPACSSIGVASGSMHVLLEAILLDHLAWSGQGMSDRSLGMKNLNM